MPEKKDNTYRPFEGKFPEETRQHFRAAREEFRKSVQGILPPEFIEHRHNARKEMLLAWRSMIDASLARMDETKKKA